MGLYEVWGQNAEENQAHGDSYSINEALNVEADSHGAAAQEVVLKGVTDADHGIGAPANGDHWHFKVVDAFNHEDYKEYLVRLNIIPTLEMAELAPPQGED